MTPDPLDHAIALLQAGRVAEAGAVLHALLDREPGHGEAMHLLGVVAMRSGAVGEAIERFTAAAEKAPRVAMVWTNLGVAHAAAGDFASALRCHERALKLEPANAHAMKNRAAALRNLGRIEESLTVARQAASRAPQDPEAWRVMADALLELGRGGEALAAYDRALSIAPGDAATHHDRGTALYRAGDATGAVAACREALRLDPDFARAHETLGLLLADLGRPDEALAACERAVELVPGHPAMRASLAFVLDLLGRSGEALDRCDEALALDGDCVPAWTQRAVALGSLGHDAQARAAHARAAELEPGVAYALVHCLHVRRRLCDWRGDALLAARIAELAADGAPCPAFALLHVPATAALQRRCAEGYARKHLPGIQRLAPGKPKARIHVGYFSADFRDHPVAERIAPVLERHDRERFELTAFSFGPESPGAMRGRIRAACERFEDLRGASDADIAALARKLGVDIAVDLMGYTELARPGIFAHRAAPVQAQYLGFPGTMGTAAMDILIADATVIAPGEEAHYSERVVRLPHTYQANDLARRPGKPPPARSALGLPARDVVYACFNERLKITPGVFASWMRILSAVEGSVLWLVDGGVLATANLRATARAAGIDPARLVFAPRVPLQEHLERVAAADIALDTQPYNGHATTSDMLVCGVPVIAVRGTTFAGRVAASLLGALGLPELVADSPAGYEALAVRLGRDMPERARLRAKVEAQRESQPLFDIAGFVRALEAEYERLVARP